jgi:hypothetical protein
MCGDTKSILRWVPSSKANPLTEVITNRKLDLRLLGKILYFTLYVFGRRRAITPVTLLDSFSPHQSLINDLDLT